MTTFVLVHGSYQAAGSGSVSRHACVPRATPSMRRPWTAVPNVGISCARASIHRPMSRKSPTCCSPPREDTENRLFADLDPATRAWVLDRDTPHPIGCSEDPMSRSSWTRAGQRPLSGAAVVPDVIAGDRTCRSSALGLSTEALRATKLPAVSAIPRRWRCARERAVSGAAAAVGSADQSGRDSRIAAHPIGDRAGHRPDIREARGDRAGDALAEVIQAAAAVDPAHRGLEPIGPAEARGRRMEPTTCVPRPPHSMPQPTAAADPLLLPPGVRATSQGLRVPRGWEEANSVVTVLPRMTAPDSRSPCTLAASNRGR